MDLEEEEKTLWSITSHASIKKEILTPFFHNWDHLTATAVPSANRTVFPAYPAEGLVQGNWRLKGPTIKGNVNQEFQEGSTRPGFQVH